MRRFVNKYPNTPSPENRSSCAAVDVAAPDVEFTSLKRSLARTQREGRMGITHSVICGMLLSLFTTAVLVAFVVRELMLLEVGGERRR